MERHGAAMLALAERVTGNAADADELVQEAFLKVWTMAPRWRADGSARFSTWLYRVVLNACIDLRRRRPTAPLDDAPEPADERADGLAAAIDVQGRAVLRQALSELPERQEAALSLHYFADLTARQAAEVLGLSQPALEALLVRGKKALRAALGRRGIHGLGDVL